MKKEEFRELVKNRNTYKVTKQLEGKLSYAKIGDKFLSDTLYDRESNILQLVEDGYLECITYYDAETVHNLLNSTTH